MNITSRHRDFHRRAWSPVQTPIIRVTADGDVPEGGEGGGGGVWSGDGPVITVDHIAPAGIPISLRHCKCVPPPPPTMGTSILNLASVEMT